MLTSLVLVGGLVLTVILGGLCYGLLNRLRHSTFNAQGKPLNAAFIALSREPRATVAQMLALALGFTAILLVEKVQIGFEPLVQGFVRVPFDDIDAIEAAIAANPNIVAILVEPYKVKR